MMSTNMNRPAPSPLAIATLVVASLLNLSMFAGHSTLSTQRGIGHSNSLSSVGEKLDEEKAIKEYEARLVDEGSDKELEEYIPPEFKNPPLESEVQFQRYLEELVEEEVRDCNLTKDGEPMGASKQMNCRIKTVAAMKDDGEAEDYFNKHFKANAIRNLNSDNLEKRLRVIRLLRAIEKAGIQSESVVAAIDSIAANAFARENTERVLFDFANIMSIYSTGGAAGKIFNGSPFYPVMLGDPQTEAGRSAGDSGTVVTTAFDDIRGGRTGNGPIGDIPQVGGSTVGTVGDAPEGATVQGRGIR